MFNNQSCDFYSDSGDDISHHTKTNVEKDVLPDRKMSKKGRWNEYIEWMFEVM